MERFLSGAESERAPARQLGHWAAGLLGAAFLLPTLALVGWLIDAPRLTGAQALLTGTPGTAMNPATALALLLSAAALWLLRDERPRRRGASIGLVFAALVCLISGAVLIDYVLGIATTLDTSLFPAQLHGNRMAPNTALALLLVGAALPQIGASGERARQLGPILLLAALGLAFLTLAGYIASTAWHLPRPGKAIPMALNTATALLALCLSGLAAFRDCEPLLTLTSLFSGGASARRLLPVVFVVPLGLGWLRLRGESWGLYDTDVGVALSVTATTILLTAFVWHDARVQNRLVAARRQAERALAQANAELERRVTERTEELDEQQAFLRRILDTDPSLIFVKDENSVFTLANKAVAELYGVPQSELAGRSDADFNADPDEVAWFQRVDKDVIRTGRDMLIGEERATDAAGRHRWFQTVRRPLPSRDGVVRHLLGISTDITARKEAEERVAHQAFHDMLTDLPNRTLFLDRLEQGMARAVRNGGHLAVVFVDLDNFKVVNDGLGHGAGDTLLCEVARRLQACVRPGDTVARLGGDEFTLLLEGIEGEAEAYDLADRVCTALRPPLLLAGHELFPGASVGVTVTGPSDRRGAEELIRDADTAMYEAKGKGKGRCVVFESSMNTRAMERLALEGDLRQALERGELRLFYQPIVDLDSGLVREVEALVRWAHPRLGLIPPVKFVPFAEETGLIVPIGSWVLAEACRQATAWKGAFPQAEALILSVNLSMRQLLETDLVSQVAAVLDETGLAARHLKLEITESMMLHDADATILKMKALRELGIRLAVDDFGTGYSSMAYLSNLPLDTLKIDRSFINRIGGSLEDEAIVRAIVGLARTLNLSVTCEGIETAEQLSCLRELGCDLGQGFLFHHPLVHESVEALLARAG